MSLTLTRASDLPTGPVRWLWPGYLPAGELGVFDGDPGLGKSLVTLDLAARVSRGRQWPDGARGKSPGTVLLFGREDQPSTVATRLAGAGADMTRVHVNGQAVRLPDDVPAIREAVTAYRARLVILDPLMSYLATNAYQDQSVREALGPLADLAHDTGCTFLAVRHLTKGAGRNPKMAGGGSVGIIGQGRYGFLFGENPEDPTRRVMAGVKQNLAVEPPSLGFHVVTKGDVPRLKWDGVVPFSDDDLLRRRASRQDREELNEIDAFLLDVMEQYGGAALANDVYELHAKPSFYSRDQMKRAKKRLGIKAQKDGTSNGPWIWVLPKGAKGAKSAR